MKKLVRIVSENVNRHIQAGKLALITAKMTFSLARKQTVFIIGYFLLALLNAVTEGFSVMLIVPLLETFSSERIFTGIPILEQAGKILLPLEPDVRLRWVAILLLMIILTKATVQYFTEVMLYMLPIRLERNLRIRAFSAFMQTKIEFSDNITEGDTGNVTDSFPARAGLALRFLIQGMAACTTIILMLALLLAIAPAALIGIGIFIVVGSIVFKAITGPLTGRLDAEMTTAQKDFTQAYFEAINNKKTIRIFNATQIFLDRINGLLERLRRVQTQTIALQNATYPFFASLLGILICTIIFIASIVTPNEAQTLLGLLLIFLVASTRLLGPFSIVHIAMMHFSIHSNPVRQMYSFLKDADENLDIDGEVNLVHQPHHVVFDNVSFHYPGSEKGINNLSLDVRPGEFVALVGPSGSGKSTVFSLLSRLRRPDAGQITIDGIALNDLRARTWWEEMAIVSQDAPVFHATIRDNIKFGRSSSDDDAAVWLALEQAAAANFVRDMPDGLDTVLGQKGGALSGGERQRLALSRAFYHRPPIILLDEVTSQLDAENESIVIHGVKSLQREDHSILAIAHRPHTIESADRIYVMRDGQVISSGTHAFLFQTNSFYARMMRNIEKLE